MIVGHLLIATLIQCLLILGATGGDSIGGQYVRKCAENNEYCQTHSDCCSNSCLTYLYRCARNYQIYPYPFLGVVRNASVTLDDILAMNFDDEVTKQPSKIASRFGTGNELGEDETKVDSIVKASVDTTMTQTTTHTPDTTTTLNDDGACKEIGSKCFKDHECCTMRCHGYLHKCVT